MDVLDWTSGEYNPQDVGFGIKYEILVYVWARHEAITYHDIYE